VGKPAGMGLFLAMTQSHMYSCHFSLGADLGANQ